MLLLPVLGTHRVSSGLDDDPLERLDSFAHFHVKLLLHRVQMIGNILAESSEECQRLLDALGDMGLTNF